MKNLKRRSIVFAPHPDDESLGCGGTIIRKKQAGAKVSIVFMTDGARSHRILMAEKELKSIREREAAEAADVLGLKERNLVFLEFENGKLEENSDSARRRVLEILLQKEPEEVFIPYSGETVAEHSATNRIVLSALRKYGKKVVVYEYPVWFWNCWPWVSIRASNLRKTISAFKKGLTSGLRLLTDFRFSVYIGDVLESKSDALQQHKSQMTRLVPDQRWKTLNDISDGEFLRCFFQQYEIFRKYSIGKNNKRGFCKWK